MNDDINIPVIIKRKLMGMKEEARRRHRHGLLQQVEELEALLEIWERQNGKTVDEER